MADSGVIYAFHAINNLVWNLGHDTLSLASSATFVLACYALAYHPLDTTKLNRSPGLTATKLITGLMLIMGEMVIFFTRLFVFGGLLSSIVAYASVITSIAFTVVINLEHRHTTASTADVALLLTAALVFDWIRITQHLYHPHLEEMYYRTATSFGIKCVLLLLNELPKELLKEPSPDETKNGTKQYGKWGFWTRTLLGPFQTGYVVDSVSALSDIETFIYRLQDRLKPFRNPPPYTMLLTFMRDQFVPCVRIITLGLLLSLFTLSQVASLSHYCAGRDQIDQSNWDSARFVVTMIFIQLGIAFCRSNLKSYVSHISENLQLYLGRATFTKLETISSSQASNPEIKALVNSDIDGSALAIVSIFSVTCDIFEILVCARWLIQSVGHMAVAIEVLIAAQLLLHRHLSDKLNEAKQAMHTSTLRRTERASDMLSRLKFIQMFGFTDIMSTRQGEYHADEMKQYKKLGNAFSDRVKIATLYYNAPGVLILGLLYLTSATGQIRAQDAFPILLVVYVHFEATRRSVESCANVKAAIFCLERIQDFVYASVGQKPSSADRGQAPFYRRFITEREAGIQSTLPDNVVDMEEASLLAHSTQSASYLPSLTLSIQRGELVMVAGSLGSGKSTLLRALIDDCDLCEGVFFKEPGIAGYCDQQPWLQHASIKSNIVGYSDYDENWYLEVLDGCRLTKDLAGLVNGDKTIIGNNNPNLSHGQEQKVALARAVYMRPAYLILDGVFGAFDYKTAMSLYMNLFAPGGIMEGCTVVLTTDSELLLEKADKVILLDSQRDVTVHTDLSSPSYRQRLCRIDLTEDLAILHESKRKLNYYHFRGHEDEETEDDFSFPAQARVYFDFFKFRDLVEVLGCIFMSGIGISLREYLVYLWLQHAAENGYFIVGYGIFLFFTNMMVTHGVWLWHTKLTPAMATQLHRQLIERTMGANVAYLTSTPHQTMLDLYGSDMNAMTENIPKYCLSLIHATFTTIIQLGLTSAMTKDATPIIAVLIGGSSFALLRYSEVACRIQLALQQNKAERDNFIFETTTGLRHIRAFGWEKVAQKKNERYLITAHHYNLKMNSINRWLEFIMDLTKGLSIAVTLILEIYVDTLTASIVAVLTIILIIYTENFVLFAREFAITQGSLRSLNRIQRAMKAMQTTSTNQDEDQQVSSDWASVGRVFFDNVTGYYDDLNLSQPVLKSITFSIQPGEKVAVIGDTASGKTTLLRSMLRQLNLHGSIEVDGIDIGQLPADIVREKIVTLLTAPMTLQGTIRSNLYPWAMDTAEAEDGAVPTIVNKILQILELSESALAAGGLETELVDLELTLQQRRLLSVARGLIRSLYHGSKIILLDDTSLDLSQRSKELLDLALEEHFSHHTIIRAIREPTVFTAIDVTVYMKHGHVVRVCRKTSNADQSAARDLWEWVDEQTQRVGIALQQGGEGSRERSRESSRASSRTSSRTSNGDMSRSSSRDGSMQDASSSGYESA